MSKTKFISTILFVTVFSVSFFLYQNNPKSVSISNKFHYAIVPHFMIQPTTVDSFYKFLNGKFNWAKNIVVISPNHFSKWLKHFESLPNSWIHELCFKDNCIKAKWLANTNLVWEWKWVKSYWDLNDAFKFEDNKFIATDHWIWEHIPFLNKYFSWSIVFPIVIKPYLTYDIEKLITYLDQFQFDGDTLFIWSVDFSHYTNEDFAKLHDKKTFYTLNNRLHGQYT